MREGSEQATGPHIMTMHRLLDYVVCSFVTALLLGCGNPDHSVGLPNGYLFSSTSPDENAIVTPDHHNILVGPSVDQYAVLGAFVIGHVRFKQVKESYFVLDTRPGTIEKNLTRPAWERMLHERGIGRAHIAPPRRSLTDW